jgi:Na+-translocating ferredoxin:NAD+ oxidoreductase RnfA subunit
MIPDYLDTLARALSFDPSLSRRVRREVEDHLLDAVAADPARDRREAERQAVARFGEPHAIAAEFARISAARQARSLAAAIVVMVFVVFIAMKARVAWYAATQWTMAEDLRPASGIVLRVDRYAFWTAVILAIAGFAYMVVHRSAPALHRAHAKHLRHVSLLCAIATAALIVSVISDGLLTAFQLRRALLCAEALIPIFSMALEVACVGMLAWQIRTITRRAAWARALENRSL